MIVVVSTRDMATETRGPGVIRAVRRYLPHLATYRYLSTPVIREGTLSYLIYLLPSAIDHTDNRCV